MTAGARPQDNAATAGSSQLASIALFWGWCLVWVSNAANSSWPASSPEMFIAARVTWITGTSLFGALTVRAQIWRFVSRGLQLAVATPLATLATLVVVTLKPDSTLELLAVGLAGLAAGFAAGVLLPMWQQDFNTEDVARLQTLLVIAALGAIVIFHLDTLLPVAAAKALFVVLPLLSGVLAAVDAARSPFTPPVPEPAAGMTYRTPDTIYLIFSLFAGFTLGLDVLAYHTVAGRAAAPVALVVVSVAGAIAAGAALYLALPRLHVAEGLVSTLLFLIAGLLAFPYLLGETGTLLQIAIASNYLCWAIAFALTQSNTPIGIRLGSRTFTMPSRTFGSLIGLVGLFAGLGFSHLVRMDSELMVLVFVLVTYLLIALMMLIVASRLSIFHRASLRTAETPLCSVCAAVADEYRLTRREREVLEILATGRSQAYIQEQLVISAGTATTHITHIYQKLGIHSRSELLDLLETRKA